MNDFQRYPWFFLYPDVTIGEETADPEVTI